MNAKLEKRYRSLLSIIKNNETYKYFYLKKSALEARFYQEKPEWFEDKHFFTLLFCSMEANRAIEETFDKRGVIPLIKSVGLKEKERYLLDLIERNKIIKGPNTAIFWKILAERGEKKMAECSLYQQLKVMGSNGWVVLNKLTPKGEKLLIQWTEKYKKIKGK